MGSLPKLRLNTLSGDDCRLLVDTVQDYAIFMLDPRGTSRAGTGAPSG